MIHYELMRDHSILVITLADGHPRWRFTSQYIEDKNFGLQRGTRRTRISACNAAPEQPGHKAPNQPEEIEHRTEYHPICMCRPVSLGLRDRDRHRGRKEISGCRADAGLSLFDDASLLRRGCYS